MENRSRMRFFLEFVSCCASPPRHTLESSSSSSSPAEEDHERWLVPAHSVNTTTASSSSSTSVSSRNRLRNKKPWKGNASDWKPSLGPISEDIVMPPKDSRPKDSRVVSREVVKKRTTAARSGAAAKVYHRSYSEGYDRSSSIAMIMPGFSPTPFMF